MKRRKLEEWSAARKRHRLSHAHVQMARELGMNPRRLGKIDNHPQEPWKAPLPEFIERLYEKRFGRDRPEVVMSIEERFRLEKRKKAENEAKTLKCEVSREGPVAEHPEPAPQGEESPTDSGSPQNLRIRPEPAFFWPVRLHGRDDRKWV